MKQYQTATLSSQMTKVKLKLCYYAFIKNLKEKGYTAEVKVSNSVI